MSFTAALTNSLAGMNAASLRAEILSFNIANATTEGYARRSVSFEPVTPGGVRTTGIERADAGRAELRFFGAETRFGGADIRSGALEAINKGFGAPGDPNGLYAVYGRFEEALEDLRLTPESGAAQLGMLRAADELATTFAVLDGEAQAMRLDADGAIGDAVSRLNDALGELDALNAEARRPRGVSLDTVAERQRVLVDEIAQELDITIQGKFGEALSLRTNSGVLLLGEDPAVLAFTPSGASSYELNYASGDFSGLTANGQDITPGSLQGLADGKIAANFAIRDVLVPEYTDRLDALAQDLVSRLEAADTTGPGGLLSLAAGTNSAAQRIGINAAIDPAQGGELWRIRDGVGALSEGPAAADGVLGSIEEALQSIRPLPPATGTPNGYSFRDAIGAVATQLGTATLRAEGLLSTAQEARTSLADEVARTIGVDTDREMQDLLLVEQAFAANARVIQATDDMLSKLLEIS